MPKGVVAVVAVDVKVGSAKLLMAEEDRRQLQRRDREDLFDAKAADDCPFRVKAKACTFKCVRRARIT